MGIEHGLEVVILDQKLTVALEHLHLTKTSYKNTLQRLVANWIYDLRQRDAFAVPSCVRRYLKSATNSSEFNRNKYVIKISHSSFGLIPRGTNHKKKKIQAFFNKTYRNRSNVQRYHEKSHHLTQDFTPELTLHAAGNTNLNLRYDLEHWATNQTSKSSETPPTSTTIGPDTIDPRSPPHQRSCHLGKGSEGLGDDQSLLSAWVLLMMEEKQLRLWGWPISIGAWFLWTISI